MSCSKKTCFRASRNVMSSGSICFENSSWVVIVARIVSPGWVWLCWRFRDGEAEAKRIENRE